MGFGQGRNGYHWQSNAALFLFFFHFRGWLFDFASTIDDLSANRRCIMNFLTATPRLIRPNRYLQ